MAQMYYTTSKPQKTNFKVGQGFQGRNIRSGSQTWSPGQVPFSPTFATSHFQYGVMPTQLPGAGLYQQSLKPEYLGYVGNGIFQCSSVDSGSPDSALGSPGTMSRDGSPPNPFEILTEDTISTVSSPGEEYADSNSYFAYAREHASIAGELGPFSHPTTHHYPSSSMLHPSDIPRPTPPQSPPPVRSRQGSTAFPLQQVPDLRSGTTREDPNSPTQKRGPKQSRSQKRGGQQKAEFYNICSANLSEDSSEEDDFEPPEMVTTLNARAQLSICRQVDEILRSGLFWWLVHYQFSIPRNPRARDIETADDRDYEGFCSVVNELTAKRWVPRDAVHHERIAELNTVLAGPAEIRHMLAHPERHLKSDWRILGLIAAAIEVCKILQYKKGHKQLYKLYEETEKQIQTLRARKLDEERKKFVGCDEENHNLSLEELQSK